MEKYLPKGWKMARLGEVVSQKKERYKTSIQNIEVLSVTNERGFVKSEEFFKKQVFSKDILGYKIVRKGDFAYNPSRINVGSVALLSVLEIAAVSPIYEVFRPNEKIIGQYLLYFLKNPVGLKLIHHYCEGSVRHSLKYNGLAKILIPLPPLSTQKKIVEILEEADSLLQLRKQADEKMQDLIPALFVRMFGDPATNPKGWETVRLGEVLKRRILQISPADYPDREFFYIGLEHIESNTGCLAKINFEFGEKILSNKNSFEAEDILYGKLRPYLNKVWLADKSGICSTDIWVLQVNKKLAHIRFISAFLKLSQTAKILNTATEGINLPRVNAAKFDKLQFPLPPFPLQQEFAACIEEIEAEKTRQAESRKKLDELFNSLMQRAFTGELVA